MLVDYLVGPDAADATKASDATMAAMQEAKKKPTKYKLAEVLGNLVLNPDGENSWNAVRSLRSMAATVVRAPAAVRVCSSRKGFAVSVCMYAHALKLSDFGQPCGCACVYCVLEKKGAGLFGSVGCFLPSEMLEFLAPTFHPRVRLRGGVSRWAYVEVDGLMLRYSPEGVWFLFNTCWNQKK